MICAYCGEEAKGTKEHIISCSILDLFPECFATIDNIRGKIHQGDPMVKDVCAICNNNKISYIDSYAKQLISSYFIDKYEIDDTLDFEYSYTLIQKTLLKYSYNDLRSHKEDTSFFNQIVLDFLTHEEISEPLQNVTILAGLAINTSPAHDYMFGNNKIRWGKDPIFLSNSIIEHIDYDTGELIIRENNPKEELRKLNYSYIFRFNSVQFLLLCWEPNISEEQLKTNKIILEHQYPYSLLSENGKSQLSRCTSETTYHFEMLIDVTWGQAIFDDISFMRGTYSDKSQAYLKELDKQWKEEEEKLAKKYPR